MIRIDGSVPGRCFESDKGRLSKDVSHIFLALALTVKAPRGSDAKSLHKVRESPVQLTAVAPAPQVRTAGMSVIQASVPNCNWKDRTLSTAGVQSAVKNGAAQAVEPARKKITPRVNKKNFFIVLSSYKRNIGTKL
jgi:hypothetical protein